jgi:predicted phage tail protein
VRAINGIGASEWSAGTTKTPYGTPTVPRNVTLRSSGDAPSDLTATWDAPSSTGGGAVTYEWRIVGTGNGWTSTAGTSGRANNVGAGTYTLEVRAINNGSGQTGPTGSDSVGVANPPPPPPTVSLQKGARTGPINNQYGYCSGDCWFYNVSVSNFPDGTASGSAYCNGTQLSTDIRIQVSGGRGSYTGRYPDSWCGYDNAYVIINGIRSNTW